MWRVCQGIPSTSPFSYSEKYEQKNESSLNLFAFILDSHDQALKHTWSPSDIPRPPPSYCGYPKVCHSRINRFSSIRMNGTRETIHNQVQNMGKLMISLSDQSENLVRSE